MISKIFFYLFLAVNWVLSLFVLILPTNKYAWMESEYGKDITLPEDGGNLRLMVFLFAVLAIVFIIGTALIGRKVFKGKERRVSMVLSLLPVLIIVWKLFHFCLPL